MDRATFFDEEEVFYDIKKKASQGAGFAISSNLINYGVSTICTIIMSRLLAPEDFGLVTMVMTVSLLLRNFGVNGFTEAVIQEKKVNHSQINSLFWIHLLINTALAIIFIAMAPAIMWFYGETRLKPIIYTMSITIIAPCFSTQHLALLKRKLMFAKYTMIEIISTVFSSALGVLLAVMGAGYWAIVVRRSAIPIIGAISSWFYCKWRPSIPKFNSDTGHLVRFAVNTYGNFTANYFSKNMDTILLAKYFGAGPLANYDRAYHLFLMPLHQLNIPLNSVAMPLLSKMKDDPARYIKYYTKAITILSLIGMLISAVVMIVGNEVITFLIGPQWHLAGKVFVAFGPAIGPMLIYQTISWVHISLGHSERYFKWGLISVVVTLVFIVGGLRYGAIGIAFGYSLSFYLLLLPGMWYALKPIKIGVLHIIKAIYKQMAAAAAAVTICWYFQSRFALVFSAHDIKALLRILILTTFCTSAYLIAIIILYAGLGPIKDAISFLKEMVPIKRYQK